MGGREVEWFIVEGGGGVESDGAIAATFSDDLADRALVLEEVDEDIGRGVFEVVKGLPQRDT